MASENEVGLTRDMRSTKPPLRAKGNLSYLQFIRLVQKVWEEAHPEIPLVASGSDELAKYPCIVYSLQLRKPINNEPKPRYREEKNDQGDTYVIGGQRFQNIVYFSAVGEAADVAAVEELIEVFEDFMMEFTPVFKEMGASELVYARRLSDTEENRPGVGTVRRTVSYMVTTEKVSAVRYDRLKEIMITARTWFNSFKQLYAPGTIYDNSPRYNLHGPEAALRYHVEPENPDQVFITKTHFRLNDLLFFIPHTDSTGDNLLRGMYVVTNIINEPYSVNASYGVTPRGADQEETEISPHIGIVIYVPEGISSNIMDYYKTVSSLADDDLPEIPE